MLFVTAIERPIAGQPRRVQLQCIRSRIEIPKRSGVHKVRIVELHFSSSPTVFEIGRDGDEVSDGILRNLSIPTHRWYKSVSEVEFDICAINKLMLSPFSRS